MANLIVTAQPENASKLIQPTKAIQVNPDGTVKVLDTPLYASDPMSDERSNSELAEKCEMCRESVRDRFSAFDRRLLALEIIVRGEDGRNGMKAQLTGLCERFDQFEKKAIRWIAVGSSLPGVVVAAVLALRFLGKV